MNNATLSTTLNYAPADTDIWTIINGGPVTGIFLNQPNNSEVVLGTFMGTFYKATIVYSGTNVVLTNPTPEPASTLSACAGVGIAIAAVRRWRSRRVK